MDVYGYIPDVISYSQLRHPYSNPNQNQNGWSLESAKEKRLRNNSAPKQLSRGGSRGARDDCKDCPICQEKQRRPLAKYIRSKSQQDRCKESSISEDSEDILEEEEIEEVKTEQTAEKSSAITSNKKEGGR